MPNTTTGPDPAAIERAAHTYAHSHYTRIDWTGAQADFTAGAQWMLEHLAPTVEAPRVSEPAA